MKTLSPLLASFLALLTPFSAFSADRTANTVTVRVSPIRIVRISPDSITMLHNGRRPLILSAYAEPATDGRSLTISIDGAGGPKPLLAHGASTGEQIVFGPLSAGAPGKAAIHYAFSGTDDPSPAAVVVFTTTES